MTLVTSEPKTLPYGPVMIDIVGVELTDLDRERLCHPLVGGLILFARNYQSPEQLRKLTDEVHALRTPPLPIAIDHEGGRVQRCREGFTRLPSMRSLGTLWERNPREAVEAARSIGFVLAAELRLNGVDLSFTPVLALRGLLRTDWLRVQTDAAIRRVKLHALEQTLRVQFGVAFQPGESKPGEGDFSFLEAHLLQCKPGCR